MNPGDVIAIVAVVLIVACAVFFIVRAKRRGQKCVGCPYSKGGCTCNCSSCNDKGESK